MHINWKWLPFKLTSQLLPFYSSNFCWIYHWFMMSGVRWQTTGVSGQPVRSYVWCVWNYFGKTAVCSTPTPTTGGDSSGPRPSSSGPSSGSSAACCPRSTRSSRRNLVSNSSQQTSKIDTVNCAAVQDNLLQEVEKRAWLTHEPHKVIFRPE